MLELEVKLTIIEDLGIKLYGSLAPVISELISNSWDADANQVNITLPETISAKSIIKIEDNGHSLSYNDIQSKYLKIGRKRRFEDGDKTKNGRKVIGSKGLGKLSVFGIANIVEITTIKNKKMTKFRMNLNDVIKSARDTGKYNPQVITDKKPTNKKNGTIIILKDLKRKNKIKINEIRKKIAKHFIIINSKFDVKINNVSISPSDKISQSDIEYVWNIKDIPKNEINKFRISGRVNSQKKWIVTGKIFTTYKTLSEEDRGIVLLSRGKLIQTGTTFGIKAGQKYSYSYMAGELSVEFLDKRDKDLISTHRQSIAWDTEEAEALKIWGDKTLKSITTRWDSLRKNEKLKKIKSDVKTKAWLAAIEPYQRPLAYKIIDIVAENQTDNPKILYEIMQYCRSSFGYTAFKNFISKITDAPNPTELLKLSEKWKLVEAREIYNIVEGRLSTIQQFERFIEVNSKEIPTIHKIFVESPWLIEPTWTHWDDEVYFSNLLKKKYPNAKLKGSNKRIDFISISTGNILNIIEIKRPQHTVNNGDMVQLAKYVSFVERHLGNVPNRALRSVVGYLISGKMPDNHEITKTVEEAAANRRYVRTYSELVQNANILHEHYKDKLPKY